MGALLTAWLIAAAAPAQSSLAGVYEIRQMEMAGGLELQANGHFRYALAYGAVDKESEGDWTFDGQAVRLTTRPMPKEPTFALVRDSAAPRCALSVSVDWGRFNWSSPPDVLVTYERNPGELHLLQADDNGALHPENCAVTSVSPLVPMFQVAGAPLKVSPATGHRLSLRFVPNDLGHVAFRGEPLKLDSNGLVLERYDAQIRFLRVRP
ncbi:MAG TPA: hypothetical protein VF757_07585 [Sphingomicrobium sp.]